MHALVLAALVGTPAAEGKAAPNLDGKWLIVYSEEGGRRNTAWESRVATGKGNTLSYEGDKKQRRSLTLSLAGRAHAVNASLAADGGDGKAYHGVCIVSRDYLCISLNPGKPREKEAKPREGSSGEFILILRRQREK